VTIIMTYDQLKQGLLEENNDCVKRLVNLFSICLGGAWLWLLSAVHRFAWSSIQLMTPRHYVLRWSSFITDVLQDGSTLTTHTTVKLVAEKIRRRHAWLWVKCGICGDDDVVAVPSCWRHDRADSVNVPTITTSLCYHAANIDLSTTSQWRQKPKRAPGRHKSWDTNMHKVD